MHIGNEDQPAQTNYGDPEEVDLTLDLRDAHHHHQVPVEGGPGLAGVPGVVDNQPRTVPDLRGVAEGGAQDWRERGLCQDTATNIQVISSSTSAVQSPAVPKRLDSALLQLGLSLGMLVSSWSMILCKN